MPFDPEELALIEAIHADPKNDAPRLSYADFLVNDGAKEHAEFIRLQCVQPYVVISTRSPDNPRRSTSFEFPYDDETANDRYKRIVELFPVIFGSDRYETQRKVTHYEEHYRGLPLLHVGDEDWEGVEHWMLDDIGHLSRLDMGFKTDQLAKTLEHPLMRRVDKLHIWPGVPWTDENDPDRSHVDMYDDFWTENIPILAASPVIDHLVELNVCGCDSTGKPTEKSMRNVAICRELLEPRVYVEYSWS